MALTKAKSKAEKLKIKRGRGRPRKECYRQPNGQPSRAKEPAAKVATEARARQYGLTVKEAMDPRSGSLIGRLALFGARKTSEGISHKQYAALNKYVELVNDYKKAIQSPAAYYVNPATISAEDEQDYTAWCLRVTERFNKAKEAVLYAATKVPYTFHPLHLLEYVVVREVYDTRFLGDLRLIANVLDHHFSHQNSNIEKDDHNFWKNLIEEALKGLDL